MIQQHGDRGRHLSDDGDRPGATVDSVAECDAVEQAAEPCPHDGAFGATTTEQ